MASLVSFNQENVLTCARLSYMKILVNCASSVPSLFFSHFYRKNTHFKIKSMTLTPSLLMPVLMMMIMEKEIAIIIKKK